MLQDKLEQAEATEFAHFKTKHCLTPTLSLENI